MSVGAFGSIRLLEISREPAGAYCAKLLADMGADVLKIEPPGTGDDSRRYGPFPNDVPDPERSGLHLYLDTSKRSVTLNLRSSDGRDLLLSLLRAFRPDVVIEEFTPEERSELAWDYESFAAIVPDAVLVSITPFGLTGPYSNYKSTPLTTFHAGGEGFLLPGAEGWRLYPEREPLKSGNLFGEMGCGLSAAVGTLAALFHRLAGGGGQHVDVSKQEALLSLSRVELARYPNEGFVESRATRNLPIGGLIECKDGFVEIMPLEPHMWDALVEEMGRPEWTQAEIFRDPTTRLAHGEEATTLIAAWAKERSKEDVYHRLQARGCAAGIVSSPKDIYASEQMRVREFFRLIDHPLAGKLRYPSSPSRFSETPWNGTPAPLLGEHNEEVYCGLLQLSREDLARLRRLGVL